MIEFFEDKPIGEKKRKRKRENNPMFHKTHSDEVKKKISKKIKDIWKEWTQNNKKEI